MTFQASPPDPAARVDIPASGEDPGRAERFEPAADPCGALGAGVVDDAASLSTGGAVPACTAAPTDWSAHVRRIMPRREALAIHAMLGASVRVACVLCGLGAFMVLSLGLPLAQTLVMIGWIMAAIGIGAALATDLRSMRIPNELSLLVLAAAVPRWFGEMLGAPRHGDVAPGLVAQYAGSLLPGLDGPILPMVAVAPGWGSAGLDLLGMVLVFVPLYLGFFFRLGFGGGDVKLMTAAALYLGWPLGFEFMVLTFIVGFFLSVAVLLGRMLARLAVRISGRPPRRDSALARLAALTVFPYASAIAISAALVMGAHLQGVLQ